MENKYTQETKDRLNQLKLMYRKLVLDMEKCNQVNTAEYVRFKQIYTDLCTAEDHQYKLELEYSILVQQNNELKEKLDIITEENNKLKEYIDDMLDKNKFKNVIKNPNETPEEVYEKVCKNVHVATINIDNKSTVTISTGQDKFNKEIIDVIETITESVDDCYIPTTLAKLRELQKQIELSNGRKFQ